MNNAAINEAIAKFFNTYIEAEGLKFGSFAKKHAWCGEQLKNKTAIGRAAVMFAMKETGMM